MTKPALDFVQQLGMLRSEVYFEKQPSGSRTCQIHALNNTIGHRLLTRSVLLQYLQNRAASDPELASLFNIALADSNNGFGDHVIESWLKSNGWQTTQVFPSFSMLPEGILTSSETSITLHKSTI